MRCFARSFVALLTLSAVLLLLPGRVFADDPYEGLLAMPPVAVAIRNDGVDARGQWVQTIGLTIRPGGSLSDASTLLYGDSSHVDALFAIAHRKYPPLASPAMIPVGLQIDVTVDPTKTYVLQSVLKSQNQVVWRYTNGVIATAYTKPDGSLSRVIAFPSGKPAVSFTYPGVNGPVQIQPGGKLVDVVYAKGESFGDVVGQVYNLTNYATAADFATQSGWNPMNWPPKPGTAKEIIVKPRAFYQQEPATIQPLPNPNPIGQRLQAAQLQAREREGITPVRLQSFGTIYHVAVSDPKLTARDVSVLLYGTPDHAGEIAKAAGLEAGKSNSSGASFDPPLFGRAFDLSVDYVDESFVLSRRVDANGVTTLGLVDGAEITNYPPAKSGPLRVVRYPTGYKRVYYRPAKTLLDVAQGLALFHVASAPWLSAHDANTIANDYAAELIWTWAPGIPRGSGDLANSMQLVKGVGGSYLVVMLAPGATPTLLGNLLRSVVFRNPFVAVALLLVVACGIVVVLDLARRSVAVFARPRW